MNWVNQVPAFGFNSGKYDVKLVKEHFIKILSNMNDMTVITKDIHACPLRLPALNS